MTFNIGTKHTYWLKTVIFFVIVALIIPFGFLFADHGAGDPEERSSNTPPINVDDRPCQPITDLEVREVPDGQGIPGAGTGEVPVFDNDTQRNLSIMIQLLSEMSAFAQTQDLAQRQAAGYLGLLCEKEYEEDHTIQHAWAQLIGDFVFETQGFISRGYGGNPAFVTNQEAYYLLVEVAVRRVFMQDIADSARLGDEAKRKIIERVALNLFPDTFPTNDVGFDPTGTVGWIAPDDTPGQLSTPENFFANGGFQAANELIIDQDGGLSQVEAKALSELNDRISRQLGYEEEKLAWGRGFFSYEVCDLAVNLRNQGENDTTVDDPDDINAVDREDRRNCRIATPGSLIQDQTSLVFGTALRQMELNDEYEEWIAPNTLAILSDILSYRGLTNVETRNLLRIDSPGSDLDVPTNPSGPTQITTDGNSNYVDIESRQDENQIRVDPNPNVRPGDDRSRFWHNFEGPLPFEFSRNIDFELYEGEGAEGLGELFFTDVLDPNFFLDQI